MRRLLNMYRCEHGTLAIALDDDEFDGPLVTRLECCGHVKSISLVASCAISSRELRELATLAIECADEIESDTADTEPAP